MNDLPDNEKLALKFKEGADVANKYRLDFARTLGLMGNNPEFKGMSEVENESVSKRLHMTDLLQKRNNLGELRKELSQG